MDQHHFVRIVATDIGPIRAWIEKRLISARLLKIVILIFRSQSFLFISERRRMLEFTNGCVCLLAEIGRPKCVERNHQSEMSPSRSALVAGADRVSVRTVIMAFESKESSHVCG